jgi:hypothetical protein
MVLHLDTTEVAALAAALDAYLPELAWEAARVERGSDARPLWERHRALQAVRDRLALEATDQPAPG